MQTLKQMCVLKKYLSFSEKNIVFFNLNDILHNILKKYAKQCVSLCKDVMLKTLSPVMANVCVKGNGK